MTDPYTVSPNGARVINNRAKTFLSRGFESLALRVAANPDDIHFDVVIIGSGYGASVAASHFSACRIPGKAEHQGKASVCVLERGSERLPGSFPTGFSDLPGELRFSSAPDAPGGNAHGLFELRLGTVASAVVANGLGGGSLINAGVMLVPKDHVLDSWPAALGGAKQLIPYYQQAQQALGVVDRNNIENNVDTAGRPPLPKYQTLQQLAGSDPLSPSPNSRPVPISVSLKPEPGQPVVTDECINCGDCAQGCNHNAKKSLDTNLLATAAFNGAEIFTGATALKFDKTDHGWEVFATHSDPTRSKRDQYPVRIRCTKVIVAAGTYATNELMFRSQAESTQGLYFSKMLGSHFSGNGDNIAAITNCKAAVNMTADERVAPISRNVGPTITGMIDLREQRGVPLALQELSIPAALKGVLTEVIGFVRVVHGLTDKQAADHQYSDELCYVSSETLNHTAIVIMMGDDGASGRLVYDELTKTVTLEWPGQHSATRNQLYKAQLEALKKLAKDNLGASVVVHDNPARNPLGEQMQQTMDIPSGPVMTVHPLGGCCIGHDIHTGVVTDNGEVYRRQAPYQKADTIGSDASTEQCAHVDASVYDGLIVLDGSVIPGAPGINPALSITALAIRAVQNLSTKWQWQADVFKAADTHVTRPVFRTVDKHFAPKKLPTRAMLTERLTGTTILKSADGPKEVLLELSMQSEPVTLADYTNNKVRAIPLATPEHSPRTNTLRIFDYRQWLQLTEPDHALKARDQDTTTGHRDWIAQRRQFDLAPDDYLDEISLFTANVTGNIELFTEQPQSAAARLRSGFLTWQSNRGTREIKNPDSDSSLLESIKKVSRFSSMTPLWKHAGRKRQLTYSLYIQKPTKVHDCFKQLVPTPVAMKGVKTFQYQPGSNPWRQMSEIDLVSFPGTYDTGHPRLVLDLFYMARKKSPLITIVQEDTLPDGYTDLAMFSMRFMRELLLHHFFSFMAPHDRKPERNTPRHHIEQLNRSWPARNAGAVAITETYNQAALPGPLAGMQHSVQWIDVDTERPENARTTTTRLNDCQHFTKARLADYQPLNGATDPTPVLLIHGYSASGTTFAHPNLTPGLAEALCRQGKHVWVLDMRSSCALYAGSHPWTFEDMAFCDIPAAIKTIKHQTNTERVDVVAHCMGAVMLSMAILGEANKGEQRPDHLGSPISQSIRRIVLSQAGPVLKFSEANTFRAFMMHYLKNLLPVQEFNFFPALANAKKNALNAGNYDNQNLETLANGVTGGDQMIDRLLATLPYPDDHEYRLEYPRFHTAPHIRERHRMDILYGRTFALKNMSYGVLRNLSDFFGPLSIETVKQTIYFANNAQITDRHGNKILRSTQAVEQHWPMPTLWIHGEHNGLIDPISAVLTQRLFDEATPDKHRFSAKILPDFGHQDSLMGKHSETNYRWIIEHLNGDYE